MNEYEKHCNNKAMAIFENKRIGNCSNNGISKRFTHVVFAENEPEAANAVKLVKRSLFGRNAWYFEPTNDERAKNAVGAMFGGSYVELYDEEAHTEILIPLHDRYETQEEYDKYSH